MAMGVAAAVDTIVGVGHRKNNFIHTLSTYLGSDIMFHSIRIYLP